MTEEKEYPDGQPSDEELENLFKGEGIPIEEFSEVEEESPARTKKLSVSEQVKQALLSGITEEELVAANYNKNTVRIIAQELEKHGIRQRPGRQSPQIPSRAGAGAGAGGKVAVYAKGSPPEALINAISVPDGQREVFETGVKFGMNIVVLGVRIAQELSAIGVQQARPLVDMAKDMRAGEVAAAKAAAEEASATTAAFVEGALGPQLAQVIEASKVASRPSTSNPMADMMTRIMEPVLSNIMNKFMPGMQGLMEGQGQAPPQPAPGWTRRREG